VAQVAFAAKP